MDDQDELLAILRRDDQVEDVIDRVLRDLDVSLPDAAVTKLAVELSDHLHEMVHGCGTAGRARK